MRGRLNRPLLLAVAAVFVLVGGRRGRVDRIDSCRQREIRESRTRCCSTRSSASRLLALIPAAAIFIYGLMQRKEIAEEMASGRYRRTGPIALILFLLVLTGIIYLVRDTGLLPSGVLGREVEIGPNGAGHRPRTRAATTPTPTRPSSPGFPSSSSSGSSRPRSRRSPSRRGSASRRSASDDAAFAEQLADVLDETLDDLRAEPDPRRAVIAAYARLERSFAAAGLPRRAEETAVEYVPRALDGLEVDPGPFGRSPVSSRRPSSRTIPSTTG